LEEGAKGPKVVATSINKYKKKKKKIHDQIAVAGIQGTQNP
jgi:hypothetical protein